MAAQRPEWFGDLDLMTPSPARVYDYFLGGAHNVEADREMARRLEQAMPDIGEIMRANRSFLRRAVRYLVSAGIRQFLDLGSGIPTVGNVHEVAQAAAPESTVVYVDIDPVAVAQSRTVLAGRAGTAVIQADLRDPETVLADRGLHAALDLDQPVAVLLLGVLHQLPGADPVTMLTGYRSALAPGSYLALSHASSDHRPQESRALRDTYNRGYAPGTEMTLRSGSEIRRLFDGFELIDPGLVQLPQWRPDSPGDVGEHPERFSTYAGMGIRRSE